MRQTDLRNGVLSRLSAHDFAAVSAHLEPCNLVRGQVLAHPGQALDHVVFPEVGVVSVVVVSAEGRSAEGGVIGREGFAAPFVVLGTDRSPNRIEVQVAGGGHRIETASFVAEVNLSESLRSAGLRYAQAHSIQLSNTAMSNAMQSVDERLARWILMCHDRCDSDEVALTHRFISVMLCVRRASVTIALQTLESLGMIRSERGYVTVLARSRLEDFASDAYGQAEAEYLRLRCSR